MSDQGIMGRLFLGLREAWRLRNFRAEGRGTGDQSDARHAYLLYLRARIMARAGFDEMALKLYQDAAERDPTFAEAFEAQGEMLDTIGQRALAVQKYELARKSRAGMRPGAPDRHFVLRQRGHFVTEVAAYDSVLRSLKKNTLPHLARGNAHLASRQPEKALQDYDRALKLKPKVPEILVLRGEALSMLGRYVEALKAFDTARAALPDDAEVLSGRAIAQMALGLLDEANADWRRQFQLLGAQAAARACVALRLTDYALALPQLDGALMKEPADPYWRLYSLMVQRRLGMPVASLEMPTSDVWPGPLFALHAGLMSEAEVLKRADTDGRRAEALFQAGVLAFAGSRTAAERHWREVVDHAAPSLIEYAAARNELARLGSSRLTM